MRKGRSPESENLQAAIAAGRSLTPEQTNMSERIAEQLIEDEVDAIAQAIAESEAHEEPLSISSKEKSDEERDFGMLDTRDAAKANIS
jgi:hypothetical protein